MSAGDRDGESLGSKMLVTEIPNINCQASSEEQKEAAWISDEIRDAYKVFHYWFATIWCTLTSISNVVTIIVLQDKSMRSTTNTLLTGVAAMHLIVSLMYIPLAQILLAFQRLPNGGGSYFTASCLLIIVISIITAQMCSIWMTVSVALFRYVCIRFPQHSSQLCTIRKASYTVALVILVCQILSIPAWLAHYVNDVTPPPAPINQLNSNCQVINNTSSTYDNSTVSGYTVMLHASSATTASIWINSQCGKFVPSLILCILSILLVKTMKSADKRRQRLVGKDRTTAEPSQTDFRHRSEKSHDRGKSLIEKDDRERKTNRTTQQLLAVAFMFILSNLPQSALELMAAFNSYFRQSVYPIIGDLMDTVAQLNNGITFVIYCTMSAQFRRTFRSIFIVPLSRKLFADEKDVRKQQSTRGRPSCEPHHLGTTSRLNHATGDVMLSILSDRNHDNDHEPRNV